MGSQSNLWRIISTAPKTVSQKKIWLFSHKRQRLQISMSDNPMGMHIPFLLASMWERETKRERESARTTIWDSTHGSVCVCLWSIGWKWLHYMHIRGGGDGGGGVSKHIQRCERCLIKSACLLLGLMILFGESLLSLESCLDVSGKFSAHSDSLACRTPHGAHPSCHCCTGRDRPAAVPLSCVVLCASSTAAFFRRLTHWIIDGTNEFAPGCRCSSGSMQVTFLRLMFHRN